MAARAKRVRQSTGSTRRRFAASRRAPIGSPPGTLIVDERASATTLRLIRIFDDHVEETVDAGFEQVAEAAQHGRIWLDVVGLADIDMIARLGELFGLDRLAIEDIVSTGQRPKVDLYETHPLVVVHMFDGRSVGSKEQVSIVFDDRHVLTFQERPGDCLDPVRKRLSMVSGRIRSRGSAYLVYAILDTILDAYFPLLDTIGEELEQIEDRIAAEPRREDIGRLHRIRRDLLVMKRALWPAREMLSALTRAELGLIPREVENYMRDTYDHAMQLIDVVEAHRELATGLLDLYLNSVSTRMNEVVKLLTMVATIFIPLSFLTGVWGMNFKPDTSPWNMPETLTYFGYPLALAIMALIGFLLAAFFWWKKWF